MAARPAGTALGAPSPGELPTKARMDFSVIGSRKSNSHRNSCINPKRDRASRGNDKVWLGGRAQCGKFGQPSVVKAFNRQRQKPFILGSDKNWPAAVEFSNAAANADVSLVTEKCRACPRPHCTHSRAFRYLQLANVKNTNNLSSFRSQLGSICVSLTGS